MRAAHSQHALDGDAKLSSVQERNGKGGTALHVAVGTSNYPGTRELLRMAPRPDGSQPGIAEVPSPVVDVNVPNRRGQHPFDIAVHSNREVAKLLKECQVAGQNSN